jgi:hypothetical protein
MAVTPPPRGTYAGMQVGRTLTTMPRELRDYTLAYVPPSGVSSLQIAGKAGRGVTRERMAELCSSLPSESEVESYLYDKTKTMDEITLAFYVPLGTLRHDALSVDAPAISIVSTSEEDPGGAYAEVYSVRRDEEQAHGE